MFFSPLTVLLAHLREETDKKFPDKGTTFAGAYMFLRFLCPALVFPENNGIISSGTLNIINMNISIYLTNYIDFQVSKGGRRCLMLISKTLQNLANGVEFREDYMAGMSGFLQEHIPRIREFFKEISVRYLYYIFKKTVIIMDISFEIIYRLYQKMHQKQIFHNYWNMLIKKNFHFYILYYTIICNYYLKNLRKKQVLK